MAIFWIIAMHVVFIHLNARNDHQLYKWWIKCTFEIPIHRDRDWQTPGLSRNKNREFWLNENRFNYYFFWTFYTSLFVFSFFYTIMLFVVPFEIDLFTYLLIQAINSAHYVYFILIYLSQVYVVSLFVNVNLTRFFVKRFVYLKNKVARLNVTSKRVNNQKLARLIDDHNRVHFELIKMNEFFRSYLGANFLCFCAIGVLSGFSLIHFPFNWKIKAYILAVVLGLYFTVIVIPFKFANSVTTAVGHFFINFLCCSI